MNERLFARLAQWLEHAPVVLASVLATRGATPRKAGARMLIGTAGTEFSIGGGLAEARVIAAAHALLATGDTQSTLAIDLRGGADAAGVCGGQMDLCLRRWAGSADRARAQTLAQALAQGQAVDLIADDVGHPDGACRIDADARLLIVGGGHCGQALAQFARALDFDIWMFDPRPDYSQPDQLPGVRCLSGDYAQLRLALDTRRAVYAVLLNRDFPSDVATLKVIAGADFAFLGMMGSARRIREVLAALPEQAPLLGQLQAPVGIEIGAQTPHEIAISILAQLIARRQALAQTDGRVQAAIGLGAAQAASTSRI